MASLYSRLRIRRPDIAFYLRSDPQTSLDLNAVYNRIVAPDDSWPEASQSIQEWEFTVEVPTATADIDALRIRYLDYPGGVLTNPKALADRRIKELVDRLRSAHGLLVLLDGQAVRDLMLDRRAGHRYLEFDLSSSFEIAQQSRCPIHFVVTKWDLLEGEFLLGAIRDKLLADENFADLVAAKERDVGATIRLIPVSSVGSGFAELQPDGSMRKTGARARPYNVEIPLVAILPDFMQFAYEELARHEAGLAEKPVATGTDPLVGTLTSPDIQAKIAKLASNLLQKYASAFSAKFLKTNPMLKTLLAENPDVIADTISGLADRLVKARAERSRLGREAFLAELENKRLSVRGRRDAFEVLERQFALMLTEFEVSHPESVIAGGTYRFIRQNAAQG
jgi:hypothetical protein